MSSSYLITDSNIGCYDDDDDDDDDGDDGAKV